MYFLISHQVLDVAGGTGDIAFRINRSFPSAHITVCDINENMLGVGEQKAKEDKTVRIRKDMMRVMEAIQVDSSRLNFVVGDGEKLPFDDNSFNLFTISFGIRNCTHVDKVS